MDLQLHWQAYARAPFFLIIFALSLLSSGMLFLSMEWTQLRITHFFWKKKDSWGHFNSEKLLRTFLSTIVMNEFKDMFKFCFEHNPFLRPVLVHSCCILRPTGDWCFCKQCSPSDLETLCETPEEEWGRKPGRVNSSVKKLPKFLNQMYC